MPLGAQFWRNVQFSIESVTTYSLGWALLGVGGGISTRLSLEDPAQFGVLKGGSKWDKLWDSSAEKD